MVRNIVAKIMRRVLFNIYVYVLGFRFYLTKVGDNDVLYRTATINFTDGAPMVVNFYRTMVEYSHYRYRRIKTFRRPRYGVLTTFDDPDHPDFTLHYHNKLMTFYVPYSLLLSEESISKFLLHMYMQYVVTKIEEAKSRISTTPTLQVIPEGNRTEEVISKSPATDQLPHEVSPDTPPE